MSKQSATIEGEDTSSSKEKQPRWSPLDEGYLKDWAVILVESLNQASDDQPTLGDCPTEADTPLEEGVPVTSPPDVEEVGVDTPIRGSYPPALLTKSTGI